jgi:hypothetical protein
VPKESLQTLGFATILEAKESFYTKAKVGHPDSASHHL